MLAAVCCRFQSSQGRLPTALAQLCWERLTLTGGLGFATRRGETISPNTEFGTSFSSKPEPLYTCLAR